MRTVLLAYIQKSRGWSISQLSDFIGDWATHNVVWDYKATPDSFRNTYGNITLTDKAERMHRLMPLEALDSNWVTNRRFASPFYGAPQRFGYNVVRLYPTTGATTVTVKFRGINQSGSDADFRWGLVATNTQFTSARYSALQKGLGQPDLQSQCGRAAVPGGDRYALGLQDSRLGSGLQIDLALPVHD